MVNITVDVTEAKGLMVRAGKESRDRLEALMEFGRRIIRQGVEAVLRAELTVVLDRDPHERVGGSAPDYRNGYRARTFSLSGLGPLTFRIPRDRNGAYRTRFLPFRKRRGVQLEELAAEMFLAGLSTRDVSRVLARHFGETYDSKEVSRMVAATSAELDAWRERSLSGARYRFLFLDGANFKVRRNKTVEKIPFLAVIGARADDEKMEVLALTVGDREKKDLWLELFHDLQRRGLDVEGVELGIMDGLPGLEDAFRTVFGKAQTQRCQVHAKRNALQRVSKKDREAFRKDLDAVFYAKHEAQARKAFHNLRDRWRGVYPTAVGIIERDLDSLLRFFQFDEKYWPSLRTTNPIERVNKEFKRRTKAMEIIGGEITTYRLLAYVGLTMNFNWRKYALSTPRHFYTLKAA